MVRFPAHRAHNETPVSAAHTARGRRMMPFAVAAATALLFFALLATVHHLFFTPQIFA